MDLHQHVTGKTHNDHDAIFHPVMSQTTALRHGHDVGRVAADQEAERVNIMDRAVKDQPATTRIIDPPAMQGLGQEIGVEHTYGVKPPDGTFRQKPTQFLVHGVAAQVMIDPQHHPCRTTRGNHVMRVGDTKGERLLAEHVFTCRRSSHGLRMVKLIGSADINGIHPVISKDCANICHMCRNGVFICELRPTFFTGTQDGYNAAVILYTNGIHNPLPGDVTCADQGPADMFIH